jgi:hypothetical protein
MNARRDPPIVGIWVGLFLLALGGAGGMAIDRIRFEPRRTAMLARVESVIQANQGTPLAIGPTVRGHPPR